LHFRHVFGTLKMQKTMKVNFKTILKVNNTDINKNATIVLQISYNSKRKRISLGIRTTPKCWNANKQLVKSTDFDYLYKNNLIETQLNLAKQVYLDFIKHGKEFSLQSFENAFSNVGSNLSFYETIEIEIKNRSFCSETRRTYITQLTKLMRFKPTLEYSEITFEFVQSYKDYMIKKLGNKPNTFYKSLSMLRTFTNWAIVKGFIKTNPFQLVQIKKIPGTRHYLTVSELELLVNLHGANKLDAFKQNILNYFLFSCYTGLRFTDIRNLCKADIKKELSEEGTEYDYISIDMHKTGLPVTIPIIPKAKALYSLADKIGKQRVFYVRCNQYTNRALKELMQIAGIHKEISFHCARHTFATVGIEYGIPIEIISSILGHTTIKQTQIYAKITQTNKLKQLMKLEPLA